MNVNGKKILLRKLPKVINKNPYKMIKDDLFKNI